MMAEKPNSYSTQLFRMNLHDLFPSLREKVLYHPNVFTSKPHFSPGQQHHCHGTPFNYNIVPCVEEWQFLAGFFQASVERLLLQCQSSQIDEKTPVAIFRQAC